jgi:hypothetical protein
MRNTYDMNAPMRAIAMPVNMYWNAMILWSVDQKYLRNQFCSAWPWWPSLLAVA